MTVVTGRSVVELLGDDAEALLDYESHTISKQRLHLPGPDFIDRIFLSGDRSNVTVRNLQTMFDHGRLGGSGYLSKTLQTRSTYDPAWRDIRIWRKRLTCDHRFGPLKSRPGARLSAARVGERTNALIIPFLIPRSKSVLSRGRPTVRCYFPREPCPRYAIPCKSG